ncbi:nucleotidyltransferase family protein [Candidatus Woesearchaeota archaeon]|nr:nucleotidyltransferase family protein [Candidatus Woesearchaeota archaeon]
MKERVTFTIEADVLRQVDSHIDGHRIKNRSHAVEVLLLKALGSNVPQKALVLAGGKGTRLKPITHEIPKPLVPLHDKPIVEHVIDLFRKYGVKEVIFAIGYKGEKIRDYFGDGRRFGMRFTYVDEKEPLGTAGCLRLAKKHLDRTFIMCNADELKNIDLHDMFMFHKRNRGLATDALTTVEDPSMYGVARLKGNQILEFIEKPKRGTAPSNLINAGLYILEPEVIDYVPKGMASLERDVFPVLAKEGRLYGYAFDGQWFDTGTMERYERAIQEWKDIE